MDPGSQPGTFIPFTHELLNSHAAVPGIVCHQVFSNPGSIKNFKMITHHGGDALKLRIRIVFMGVGMGFLIQCELGI